MSRKLSIAIQFKIKADEFMSIPVGPKSLPKNETCSSFIL